MTNAMEDLAKSIVQESGLIWKIWTENPQQNTAGGIYLFDTEINAKAYLDMHSKRLDEFGIKPITGKIFAVNKALSLINKAPL